MLAVLKMAAHILGVDIWLWKEQVDLIAKELCSFCPLCGSLTEQYEEFSFISPYHNRSREVKHP